MLGVLLISFQCIWMEGWGLRLWAEFDARKQVNASPSEQMAL